MKNRITKKTRIQTTVQEKTKHSGFMEQNAGVESSTVRTKKSPLEHFDHSGQHGKPYKKK